VEGEGGVLHGADQQQLEEVPVVEVGPGEGLAAAPAADEVDQAVDPAEVLLDTRGPVLGGLEVEQIDGVTDDGGSAVGEAGRVHGLGQPLRVVVRADDGRTRLGQPEQRRAPGGSARAGHRDHRTAESPIPHDLRLLSVIGAVAHAATCSAASARMPRVEAITFFSFLDSAS
jgi:hypothetical protein